MDFHGKTWMHDLAYGLAIKDFLRMPLCRMALPGAHAAGTCGIPLANAKLQLTPDASPRVRALVSRGLQATVRDWMAAQSASLLEQMNAGARYLHLRVAGEVLLGPALTPERIAPALCHWFRSIRVSDALEQVADFLRTNPRELVIIDFSSFHGMSGQQHREVVNMLRKRLGRMMVHSAHGPQLSLEYLEREFSGVGRAIVVYGQERERGVLAQHPDILWPRECLPSPGAGAGGVVLLDQLEADRVRGVVSRNIPPGAQARPTAEAAGAGPAAAARPHSTVRRPAGSGQRGYRKTAFGAAGPVLEDVEAAQETPAVCEFQGRTWIAWKASDGEGSVCVAPIDGAEGRWQLQCDGVRMATRSGPSIASFQGRLYVFWRSPYQDQLVYAVSCDGIHWQGAFTAGAGVNASQSGPAVAVWRERLYMVWCSAHGQRPCYAVHDGSSHYGSSWTEARRICGEGIAPGTPALMAGEDGHLYVAWRCAGVHQALAYARCRDHGDWSSPIAVLPRPGCGGSGEDGAPMAADGPQPSGSRGKVRPDQRLAR